MGNEEDSQGHPAWKELLSQIPEEYHAAVMPQLEQWDKNFQQKVQELNTQYEPYKPLVDNHVDMDYIDQAIYLAQQMQSNPQEVVQRAIDSFELPYEMREQIKEASNVGNLDEWDGLDITTHPQYQQLMSTVETLSTEWTERKNREQLEEQQQNTQEYLKGLHKDAKGEDVQFDDMYVTALLAAGLDGPTAVRQYQETVNNAALALQKSQQTQLPEGQQNVFRVLDGSSGSGSGVPSNQPNFGTMKKNDLNDIVSQILTNAKNASDGN